MANGDLSKTLKAIIAQERRVKRASEDLSTEQRKLDTLRADLRSKM